MQIHLERIQLDNGISSKLVKAGMLFEGTYEMMHGCYGDIAFHFALVKCKYDYTAGTSVFNFNFVSRQNP